MAHTLVTLTFASIFGLALLLIGTEACFKKFSNQQEFGKASSECMKNLSRLLENVPTVEDYANPEFDDKCYGRCVLEAMDMLTDSKGLDRDALFDMIEENAPKTMVNKLTEAVSKCSESSGVVKLSNKSDCHPFAQFNGCMMMAAEKLC